MFRMFMLKNLNSEFTKFCVKNQKDHRNFQKVQHYDALLCPCFIKQVTPLRIILDSKYTLISFWIPFMQHINL